MAKTFDSKCFDLAEAFLSDFPGFDTEKRCSELAAEIQQTIEDFLTASHRCESCGGEGKLYSGHQNDPEPRFEGDCTACDGTGKVTAEDFWSVAELNEQTPEEVRF
jgi:hypothetical protein